MASVDTGGGEQKKGKPQKMSLRVDFTPMVDMNMLLITFFMFCTTLLKPQIMEIIIPADSEEISEEDQSKIKDSDAITLILGEDNKIYYYWGKPKYDDYTSLKETNYEVNGLREMLSGRNKPTIEKVYNLKLDVTRKKIKEEDAKEQIAELRRAKGNPNVLIKPTDMATYENLVAAIDEMFICSIGVYAIVPPTDGDFYLIENYKTKGAYGAERSMPE